MLDVKLGREGPEPKAAATVLCLRDAPGGLEILCVERAKASGFLGGAIVFPGGKVDAGDTDEALLARATAAPAARDDFAEPEANAALAVAACRECFEEAGLLFHRGPTQPAETRRALRQALLGGRSFGDVLDSASITLDLAALVPFARWITPVVETRRFDTRFYLARAPGDQDAVHDARETTMAFWATPKAILARFDAGECQLFPPTHRSLELLAALRNVDDAFERAAVRRLMPICPELVVHRDALGETMALTLPGDLEHSLGELRIEGATRYVLRGERWVPS